MFMYINNYTYTSHNISLLYHVLISFDDVHVLTIKEFYMEIMYSYYLFISLYYLIGKY